ncbi:phosphotransferase family protein [Paenibacillus residui]|uniref:Phosphotransferase family protein n=1 Tax=Paenibacillus residui TaxID=629724 RepID=A0ABW3DA00_9BACL
MDSGNAEAEIQLIWQEHQLGEIQQLIPLPCQGNQRFVVNGSHIVHLSAGDSAVNGLRSEAEAYRILASSLPVPEMVLYDESRQVIPRSFLITICPPGSPVSESWPGLEMQDRERLAMEAGRHLAILHGHSLPGFTSRQINGLSDGYRYIQDQFRRIARRAINADAIEKSTVARIKAVLDHLRPLFERVKAASFLHGHFHMGQLWQHNGWITGWIGFEFAHSGDPVFDFRTEDRLESDCPGSLSPFYKGYTQVQTLDTSFALKRSFCKLLFNLESFTARSAEYGGTGEENRTKLSQLLRSLELNPG